MSEVQETVDPGELAPKLNASEVILASLKNKVPRVKLENVDVDKGTSAWVEENFKSLLGDDRDSPQKRQVTRILQDCVTAGLLSYQIKPMDFIIVSSPLESGAIGEAGTKKIGPDTIYQFKINPVEIMFRIQVLISSGVSSAKNIADILFVAMHEIAHLGQAKYAPEEKKKSIEIEYKERPTEKHADEVALAYCRDLLAAIQAKSEKDDLGDLLLLGLPDTIRDAEVHGRPSM